MHKKENYRIKTVDGNSMILHCDAELLQLCPPLSHEEETMVENDVKQTNNIRDAVIVWKENNIVIDGRMRVMFASKYDLQLKVTYLSFDNKEEVKEWVIKNHFMRRNLSQNYKRLLRGKHYNFIKKQGERNDIHDNNSTQKDDTAKKLSRLYKVSRSTIVCDGAFALHIEKLESHVENQLIECLLRNGNLLTRKDIRILAEDATTEERRNILEIFPNSDNENEEWKQQVHKNMTELRGKYKTNRDDSVETNDDNVNEDDEGQNEIPEIIKIDIRGYEIEDIDKLKKIKELEIAALSCLAFIRIKNAILSHAIHLIKFHGFKYITNRVIETEETQDNIFFEEVHELELVCSKGTVPNYQITSTASIVKYGEEIVYPNKSRKN